MKKLLAFALIVGVWACKEEKKETFRRRDDEDLHHFTDDGQ